MREHSNAALRGIPIPAPIAASLVEQLGHEAEDPALLGWLLAQVVATPPTVGHPWLEENVAVVEKVVVVVAVKTPPTATFVRVLVTVWVDSESVPEPIKNPPPTEQHASAGWPRPQQNKSSPQGKIGQKDPVSTALVLVAEYKRRNGKVSPFLQKLVQTPAFQD
jgi:hypothetical protein